ncbi:class I SAM-dependent DNA methyltransferase [Desulfotruncus alcoholivorax]|uniref:class I SAM-dependent DNA methyltransferase n=1 Tax=Desulfotruncus alcoholivorax TaxID=265477 RepID=UPI00041A6139|nr:class I SAM-dependent methyltransferase [Desulfotruncus alcoholivorax]
MNQYSGLSSIYDYLVSGVDFEGWIDYAELLLKHFGLHAGSVADIACGTGKTTIPFAKRGYKTFGVDISEDMVALASNQAAVENIDINFSKQDMRHFFLPEKVDLVTCFHDGLNYLTDIKDIVKTFKSVNKNLNKKGSFIFDLNTVIWLSDADESVHFVDENDITLIWQTSYNKKTNIWSINLTGFFKEGDHYHKFHEIHHEKAYSQEEIKLCLDKTGFTLLGSFDAFKLAPAHEKSIRIFYVARKSGND